MNALTLIGLALILIVLAAIGFAWWWIENHADGGDGPRFPDR